MFWLVTFQKLFRNKVNSPEVQHCIEDQVSSFLQQSKNTEYFQSYFRPTIRKGLKTCLSNWPQNSGGAWRSRVRECPWQPHLQTQEKVASLLLRIYNLWYKAKESSLVLTSNITVSGEIYSLWMVNKWKRLVLYIIYVTSQYNPYLAPLHLFYCIYLYD